MENTRSSQIHKPNLVFSQRLPQLISRVKSILLKARHQALQTVNAFMIVAYWRVGREIVEEEQYAQARANDGKRIIENLAIRLASELGTGASKNNLWYMRQFYLAYTPALIKSKFE